MEKLLKNKIRSKFLQKHENTPIFRNTIYHLPIRVLERGSTKYGINIAESEIFLFFLFYTTQKMSRYEAICKQSHGSSEKVIWKFKHCVINIQLPLLQLFVPFD